MKFSKKLIAVPALALAAGLSLAACGSAGLSKQDACVQVRAAYANSDARLGLPSL